MDRLSLIGNCQKLSIEMNDTKNWKKTQSKLISQCLGLNFIDWKMSQIKALEKNWDEIFSEFWTENVEKSVLICLSLEYLANN